MQENPNVPSQGDTASSDALREQIHQLRMENRALEERLLKYQLAAQGANDGLWDWDLMTQEAFVSEPWKRMLGREEEDFSAIWDWKNLLHPEDTQHVNESLKRYLEKGFDTFSLEFRLRHSDGSYKWIYSRGRILRDDQTQPYRISGSHTDITDRKKYEEALIKSERKFRNLFENSLVGMMRTDLETGKIIEANAKAWELLKVYP
ncbi:MAG: PAS domain-containing protein, partial [Cytophagales bacterium]|nr:PAS domain-containing protein [Cytophagales bacterium]